MLQLYASAGCGGTPGFLGHAPVDALQQIAELRGRDRHGSVGRRGPQETAALQPLRVEAQALAIMPKDFNQIAAPAPKDKQMAAVRVTPERLLHEQGQAVEALAHVRVPRREPHPHAGRDRDHERARTAMTRASAAPFTSLSTITRPPPTSTISITPRAP